MRTRIVRLRLVVDGHDAAVRELDGAGLADVRVYRRTCAPRKLSLRNISCSPPSGLERRRKS